MNTENRKRNLHLLLYVFAIIGIASAIYSGISIIFTRSGIPTTYAQTDPFLDRRISQIENRFYSIESRINRIEQEARLPDLTSRIPGSNDTETRLLRSQIDTLQIRVSELECELLRLDERTLSEAVRRARRTTDAGTIDRCRLNPNEPLRLSARP